MANTEQRSMGAMLEGAPAPVRTSFYLWLAVVVLGLVNVVITVIGSEGGGGAPVGVVFLVLIRLCARKMLEGANWARITLAVIGVVMIALAVFSLVLLANFGEEVPVWAVLLSVVQVVLILGAAGLAFHRDANRWFRARAV